MPTLLDSGDRAEIVRRLKNLSPESARQWGSLSPTTMVTHLIDSTRMMLGEVAGLKAGAPVASWPVIKQLLMFYLPIPPGKAKTAPQLLETKPTSLTADTDRLCQLLDRFAAPEASVGSSHPFFGRMDKAAWGRLGYRHFDHHLRQFSA